MVFGIRGYREIFYHHYIDSISISEFPFQKLETMFVESCCRARGVSEDCMDYCRKKGYPRYVDAPINKCEKYKTLIEQECEIGKFEYPSTFDNLSLN